jgi:hypothetical protein
MARSSTTEFLTAMELPHSRLFILGSGFSKPAGLPLGPELLASVRAWVRNEFLSTGWDGPLEKEISEWRELYPNEQLTLESALAYSHRKHFLRLIGSDEYFSHGSRTIVASRSAVQAILINATPTIIPPLYNQFAARLTPWDTVLTFNYDTLLEDTLDIAKVPYSLTPEWWLDRESGEFMKRYVEVIKLHGSIDWYDRGPYELQRQYFAGRGAQVPDRDPLFGPAASVPTESLARGSVEREDVRELLRRVVRVPGHSLRFPLGPDWEVVPFLLPPAHDKLLGHDPIRALWQDMHRAFATCSAIVIVGYSMPSYDGYAYEALGRILIDYQAAGPLTSFGHRRVPVQLITLASTEASALAAIPFLKPERTRVWQRGFSPDCIDWLDWGW